MSNNFDDIIRRKLQEIKVDFNPEDWKAMEAMLDKSSDKGGAWYWKLPFIGLILLGSLVAAGLVIMNDNAPQHENSVYASGLQPDKPSYEKGEVENIASSQHLLLSREQGNSDGTSEHNLSSVQEDVENNEGETLKVFSDQNPQDHEYLGSTKMTEGEITNASELLAIADINKSGVNRKARVEINPVIPYSYFNETRITENSLSGTEYPVKNYSIPKWQMNIGFTGGMSLSYLDDNLMPRAGYTIGLSIEGLFKSKFGAYSGIQFALQEYETSKFDCDPSTRYRCPVYYTSIIKSIEIPVGIRYNYWNKSNWKLYAKVGISNYIKLEEKFNYIFEPDNSDPPPPRSNSFRYNQSTSSLVKTFYNDFTLSEAKRYHFSYSTSLGFEKFIGRQMSITFEPNFQVTGTKAGNKDARLYTISAIGSLKFYPGR